MSEATIRIRKTGSHGLSNSALNSLPSILVFEKIAG